MRNHTKDHLQSASWYSLFAFTSQKRFSRYARPNDSKPSTRAACPVSNMLTCVRAKSRAYEIDAEVLLQPDHVHVGAVEDLHDGGVGEDLVQQPHVVACLQHVHQIVGLARGDLGFSARDRPTWIRQVKPW